MTVKTKPEADYFDFLFKVICDGVMDGDFSYRRRPPNPEAKIRRTLTRKEAVNKFGGKVAYGYDAITSEKKIHNDKTGKKEANPSHLFHHNPKNAERALTGQWSMIIEKIRSLFAAGEFPRTIVTLPGKGGSYCSDNTSDPNIKKMIERMQKTADGMQRSVNVIRLPDMRAKKGA
jgi:hypothetical protein